MGVDEAQVSPEEKENFFSLLEKHGHFIREWKKIERERVPDVGRAYVPSLLLNLLSDI